MWYVGVGVDAMEEEVVVEVHAGYIEGIGFGWVAGEINDERPGLLRLVSEA